MSKVAVVYWSGTGNTEAMSEAVERGAQAAGAEVSRYSADAFDADMMDRFDAVAFGCPSMGDEVLEEGEFEPMFTACEPKLKDKKIALFGSYDWGDGEWMRNWNALCLERGAVMACDFVIANNAPDAEALAACEKLGTALA